MAVSDKRIALRDHAAHMTPIYALQATDRLEQLLNNAGISTAPAARIDMGQLIPVLQPLLTRFQDEVELAGNTQLTGLLAEIAALHKRSWQEVRYDLGVSFANGLGMTREEQQVYNELQHEFVMGMHHALTSRPGWDARRDQHTLTLSHFVGFAIPVVVYSDLHVNAMHAQPLRNLRVFASRGPNRVDFDANFELLLRVLDVFLAFQTVQTLNP